MINNNFIYFLARVLFYFVFLYPIIMTIFWIIGTVVYYRNYQRYQKNQDDQDLLELSFTIVMPIHNEQDVLDHVISQNLKLDYHRYELLIVDDFSSDDSYNIALKWAQKDKRVKVYKTSKHLGKANALNEMLDNINTKYFICIDGDSYLEPNALKLFNYFIATDPKISTLAAITGQPKLVDGDISFIHKLQRIDYRSIISMIKKSQGLFNYVYSVSGVCTLYNTSIIKSLNGFNVNNQTEDIEITWRLQRSGFHIRYEPSIMVHMYTPNTLKQLFRQRTRWSVGGIQTINQNIFARNSPKLPFTMKLFVGEFLMSTLWAISFFVSTVLLLFFILSGQLTIRAYLEMLSPMIVLALYSFVLMYIGFKYEIGPKEPFKVFWKFSVFISLFYWMINPIALFFALIKYYIFGQKGGTWQESRS